ncbi:MAG TPA: bifunctional adenosylcobinamide kinase/adenosylcobinamide-phosphate guanylyltransferase [Candidatus Bathyarchaeia archaeon]|nr:bifunctional adenosylcobinamide kinase/adenosylcobinamide-phosphate guanylyltransferase [Candidatus Bathyarchaeia archaeon]
MRYLIVGANNSGKSEHAEMLLIKSGQSLGYFATLPPKDEHRTRILRHEERRDSRWVVHQANYELSADISSLNMLLEVGAVLFDGLSIYLRETILMQPDSASVINALNAFCTSFTQVLSRALSSWIVVDVAWEYLTGLDPYELVDWTRYLQSKLVTECGAVRIYTSFDKMADTTRA